MPMQSPPATSPRTGSASGNVQALHWTCAQVNTAPLWLAWCRGILPNEEIDRCDGFIAPAMSMRYCAARGSLRRLLAQFTAAPVAQLDIRRGKYGKPHLVSARACSFNFSDSAENWAAAMHEDRRVELGIDIEWGQRFANAGNGLLRSILSAEESAHWNDQAFGQDSVASSQALATVWTRKEALYKAVGVGLMRKMSDISVGWARNPVPVRLTNISGERKTWHLHELAGLPHGFLGCIAADTALAAQEYEVR